MKMTHFSCKQPLFSCNYHNAHENWPFLHEKRFIFVIKTIFLMQTGSFCVKMRAFPIEKQFITKKRSVKQGNMAIRQRKSLFPEFFNVWL